MGGVPPPDTYDPETAFIFPTILTSEAERLGLAWTNNSANAFTNLALGIESLYNKVSADISLSADEITKRILRSLADAFETQGYLISTSDESIKDIIIKSFLGDAVPMVGAIGGLLDFGSNLVIDGGVRLFFGILTDMFFEEVED